MSKKLDAAEAAYGFQFGDPTNEHASAHRTSTPNGIIACNVPTCPRHGEMLQVFTDTELPIHCGGCGTILADNPNPAHPDQSIPRAGLHGAPLPDTTTALIDEIKRQVLADLKASTDQ